MNILAPLLVLFLAFQSLGYQDKCDIQDDHNAVTYSIDHSAWTEMLMTYVDAEGYVNYRDWKDNEQALNRYLDYLADNRPVNSWSKNQLLAYYINLYNAATIQLILENYPVKSIKDIPRPWGKSRVRIGPKKVSLGHIEHQILRKMDEPRIHFAINCASNSCPKIIRQAYEPDILEEQLEQVTRDFLQDPKRNRISPEKLQLSNVFRWYKKDFTKNGSLQEYIAPYIAVSVSPQAEIEYLPYDWNLNEITE